MRDALSIETMRREFVGKKIEDISYDPELCVMGISFKDGDVLIISTEMFMKGFKNGPN